MDHLFNELKEILGKYRAGLPELPWLRAAGLWAAIVACLTLLLKGVTEALNVTSWNPGFAVSFIAITFSLYFLLVALMSHEQLQTERKIRKAETPFRYGKRGTLFNGTEPNIAFRIVTFNNILSQLGNQIGFEQMIPTLHSAGEEAASDFAIHLENIYNKNIVRDRGGALWNELGFKEKITEWLEYDSQTGWGILTGQLDIKSLQIKVAHLEKLYEGAGGQLFGHFLAGYCKTIISLLLASHSQGYQDCSTADVIGNVRFKSGEMVEIDYKLR